MHSIKIIVQKACLYLQMIIFLHCSATEQNTWFLIGNTKNELYVGDKLEFLTPQTIDQYTFLLNTSDLIGSFDKHIHKDICLSIDADVRAQFILGYSPTKLSLKLGLGKIVDSYYCFDNAIDIRLRSLNTTISFYDKFYISCGIFPFEIGKGLILGNAHKINYLIPGLWTEEYVNQWRPGIQSMWKPFNNITFEAYYGLIYKSSVDMKTTYAYDCAHNLYSSPFLGVHKGNYIAMLSTSWTPIDKHLSITPFILHQSNQNQHVELPHDAHLNLFNFGFTAKAKNKYFKLYLESSVQKGKQYVYALDRNQFAAVSTSQQTHLFYQTTLDSNSVWQSAQMQTYPEDLGRNQPAGAEFTNTTYDQTYQFKNSYSRFRKGYCNILKGFETYGEFSLYLRQKEPWNISSTVCVGHLSGDHPPNDSTEKILINRFNPNGSYKDYAKSFGGFVGTEQLYHSHYINAYFLQFAQKLQPNILTKRTTHTSTELSNRIFAGCSCHLHHTTNTKQFSFNINLLAYSLDEGIKRDYSYPIAILYEMDSDAETINDNCLPVIQQIANLCPQKYLGTEINCSLNFKYKEFLNIFANGAVFFPGTFYNTMVGANLPLQTQRMLAARNYTGIEISQNTPCIYLYKPKTSFLIKLGFSVTI